MQTKQQHRKNAGENERGEQVRDEDNNNNDNNNSREWWRVHLVRWMAEAPIQSSLLTRHESKSKKKKNTNE